MAAEERSPRDRWLAELAGRLGTEPPTPDEADALLRLAALAAHGTERTAAPLAAWLAGRSGLPVADVLRLAAELDPGAAAEPPD